MDPISDMLASIKNAQAVSKKRVKIPFSRLKFKIAKLLEKEGFLEKVNKKGKKTMRVIEIALKYKEGEPVISGLKRVSKPGQRIYLRNRKIRPVKSGFGIAIISTSHGLMTGQEARKKSLGGEVICRVW